MNIYKTNNIQSMQCFHFIYKKSVQPQNSTNNIYQCNVFVSFIRKADNIRIVQIISINAMFSFLL